MEDVSGVLGAAGVSAVWVRDKPFTPCACRTHARQGRDGVPPYADVPLDISPLQAYDISLHLSVPALESNYALGNFMASLTLSTPANTTLTSIRRPVRL